MEDKIIKAAKACIEFIKQDGGNSSFVNIEHVMEQHGISISDGQEGGYVLNFGKDYSNIVLWVFQSIEAHDVWHTMTRLLDNKNQAVQVRATQTLIYLVDGKVLNMPLAKSKRNYKKPHWLPTVLSIQNKEKERN